MIKRMLAAALGALVICTAIAAPEASAVETPGQICVWEWGTCKRME